MICRQERYTHSQRERERERERDTDGQRDKHADIETSVQAEVVLCV